VSDSDSASNEANLPKSALIALAAGAVGTTVYSAIVTAIPFPGVSFGLGFLVLLAATALPYSAVSGAFGVRLAVGLVGAIINLACLWFVWIGISLDFGTATDTLLSGPLGIWDFTNFYYNAVQISLADVSGDTSLPPGFLITLWVLEAIMVAALPLGIVLKR
jgi:hypothetical protein